MLVTALLVANHRSQFHPQNGQKAGRFAAAEFHFEGRVTSHVVYAKKLVHACVSEYLCVCVCELLLLAIQYVLLSLL